jgi:hypothetical protein
MSGTGDGHDPVLAYSRDGRQSSMRGRGVLEKDHAAFPETNKKASRGPDADRIQGGEAFSFDIQTGLLRLAQNRKQQNNN